MLSDIPEKEWNVLNHKLIFLVVVFGCGGDIFMNFSKLWDKSEYHQFSKIVSMSWNSSKNLFKMIQKHLKVVFDSTDIICDHSDHVTAKVDRGEPVQVVRMVIQCIMSFSMDHITILMTWTGSSRSTFAVTWSEWSHMITVMSNMTCKCFWMISNEYLEDFQPTETIFQVLLYSEFRDFHGFIASTSKYND